MLEHMSTNLKIKDSETPNETIFAAKNIKTGSYYENIAVERKRKGNNKWEGNMNELAQQIQNMTTNYAKLTVILTIQAKVNKSCPRLLTRVNVIVISYQCNEKGH
ncbi:22062_t:CDS:2 [Cetraspora pellucida]|uniref:22062_t:CDS:1 n=1 Tax=Cetraspora pellucida TaxID=1433469 RepID=A0A9N9A1Z8_9GLOM|nr:22062_t:CDS:2 [Cetraspora pellucida]